MARCDSLKLVDNRYARRRWKWRNEKQNSLVNRNFNKPWADNMKREINFLSSVPLFSLSFLPFLYFIIYKRAWHWNLPKINPASLADAPLVRRYVASLKWRKCSANICSMFFPAVIINYSLKVISSRASEVWLIFLLFACFFLRLSCQDGSITPLNSWFFHLLFRVVFFSFSRWKFVFLSPTFLRIFRHTTLVHTTL